MSAEAADREGEIQKMLSLFALLSLVMQQLQDCMGGEAQSIWAISSGFVIAFELPHQMTCSADELGPQLLPHADGSNEPWKGAFRSLLVARPRMIMQSP